MRNHELSDVSGLREYSVGGKIDRMLAWGYGVPTAPLARPDDQAGVARVVLKEASWGQQDLHQRYGMRFYAGPYAEPMNGEFDLPAPAVDIAIYAYKFTEGLYGEELENLVRKSLLLAEDAAYVQLLSDISPAEHNITTVGSFGDSLGWLNERDYSLLHADYKRYANYFICHPSMAEDVYEPAKAFGMTVLECSAAYPDVAYAVEGTGFIGVGGETNSNEPQVLDWGRFTFGHERLTMSVMGFVAKIVTVR